MQGRLAALVFGAFFAVGATSALARDRSSATELNLAIDHLDVAGSALYIAAHPDDENTALLAWLARGLGVRTTYLSLTRGDGGQNLIGTEQGVELGLIRTQELLAARALDGADQRFSRAVDFGYSKTTEEALSVWNEDTILADVVWAIRSIRPDIVISRFTPTVGGHGHHTASAELARKAFEQAGDKTRFPEQLRDGIGPWQPRRLFWNAWRIKPEERKSTDPQLVAVDLGTFNPALGLSYNELAARSRSFHKSQGFGTAARRGSSLDYLEFTTGEPLPPGTADPFAGIDTTLMRIPGSEKLTTTIAKIQTDFDRHQPWLIVASLLEAYHELAQLPPNPWSEWKSRQLRDTLAAASGLWIEALADRPEVAAGTSTEVIATILNRSPYPFRLKSIGWTGAAETQPGTMLEVNRPTVVKFRIETTPESPLSQPHWLRRPPRIGSWDIEDLALRGQAESPPSLIARFVLESTLDPRVAPALDVPVTYRWVDSVRGELEREVAIVPRLSVALDDVVYFFPNSEAKAVRVTVASAAAAAGVVRLELGVGFASHPIELPFVVADDGSAVTLKFAVTPSATNTRGEIAAVATVDGQDYRHTIRRIEHPHIPVQLLFPEAKAKLVAVDLGAPRPRIGYVMGPGDKIPEALRQAGYDVTLLGDDDLAGDLQSFDTIVTGVRAYNTRKRLVEVKDLLLQWVGKGKTLVVQYNVTADLLSRDIGPWPFTVSHDRVTREDAAITFVDPRHPLLTTPNQLTAADFDGWVQERGLYFSTGIDPRYQTPLACNDPGEAALRGGELYTCYGEGVFIYTSYSWFRQLPAGVPGAFRAFANLLAGGRAAMPPKRD